MSDEEADKAAVFLATWAIRGIIILAAGVFIILWLLISRYPKVMLPLIGIAIAIGIGIAVFQPRSSYEGYSQSSSYYSDTGATGSSSDASSSSNNSSTSSTSSSASSSSSVPAGWSVRLSNMDDQGEAWLNGAVVAKAAYNEDSGWVDLTSQMHSGDNSLYLHDWNIDSGYAWSFQIAFNGNIVWSNQAGTVGEYGANNDDRTRPNQDVYEQTLILKADGTVVETSTSPGTEQSAASTSASSGNASNYGSGNTTAPSASASGISVGSVVEVTSNELNVHDSPGPDAAILGTVIKGTRLAVKDGPVQVAGRNWWQVSGWDDNGSLGWSSEQFLQHVDGGLNQISVGSTVAVNYFNLNVRTQPDTNAQLVTTLKQGAVLQVIGGPTNVDGHNWWQVTGWDSSGSTGWCSGKYLKLAQ